MLRSSSSYILAIKKIKRHSNHELELPMMMSRGGGGRVIASNLVGNGTQFHLLLPSVSTKLQSFPTPPLRFRSRWRGFVVESRDRSKNRKPLQRGRNLSIEAIQTVQALKRAHNNNTAPGAGAGAGQLQGVLDSKFRRLVKFDMVAVLRELLRQNQCLLSLLVFEDVRREYWYKPQASLYAEIISVLGSNGLFEQVELIFSILKTESSFEAKTQDLNALLESLMSCNMTGLAMECFYFMKSLGCEPDRSTFRILVNHLESNGETICAESIRQEAQKYYGEPLEFLEEQEEVTIS